jgi:hypothetical protein
MTGVRSPPLYAAPSHFEPYLASRVALVRCGITYDPAVVEPYGTV